MTDELRLPFPGGFPVIVRKNGCTQKNTEKIKKS